MARTNHKVVALRRPVKGLVKEARRLMLSGMMDGSAASRQVGLFEPFTVQPGVQPVFLKAPTRDAAQMRREMSGPA